MVHTIEFPNPSVYVFIYDNNTGFCDYTYVNTNQVFDTILNYKVFNTFEALQQYATENGFTLPNL